MDWDDVCLRFHNRKIGLRQHIFGKLCLTLMPAPLFLRYFEVPDRLRRCGCDNRGECCREDETRRVGAYGVDHAFGTGDITAQRAESLGQRTFDNINTV